MFRLKENQKLRPDLPPHRGFRLHEVLAICTAGGFALDEIPGRTFCVITALDDARRNYLASCESLARRLTDKQLNERLDEVARLSSRLLGVLGNGSLFAQADKSWNSKADRNKHPAYNCDHLMQIHAWAKGVDRHRLEMAASSKVGINEDLFTALICTWCGATGNTSPDKREKALMLAFVAVAHKAITQTTLSAETIAKRVSENFKRAVRSINCFFPNPIAAYVDAERMMIEMHKMVELKHLHPDWIGWTLKDGY